MIQIRFCYNTNGAPGRTDATEEQIREEVRRCMNEYGKYRGFIFFGFLLANSLDPKEKLTSFLPMIQEAESYRQNNRLDIF